MRCSAVLMWLLLGHMAIPAADARAQTETIAGRTIDQYRQQLDSSDRTVRLRAIRSLGGFGILAGDVLRTGLAHDDAAVRYLAAVELGRIGGEPLASAKSKLQTLANDPASYSVRIAASYALCRDGEVDAHLPLLIETLDHPIRGMACSAAELIGQLGPPGEEAIPALRAAIEKNRPGSGKGDSHIGGAAINALHKIEEPVE